MPNVAASEDAGSSILDLLILAAFSRKNSAWRERGNQRHAGEQIARHQSAVFYDLRQKIFMMSALFQAVQHK
jgi:hypothetical protein